MRRKLRASNFVGEPEMGVGCCISAPGSTYVFLPLGSLPSGAKGCGTSHFENWD